MAIKLIIKALDDPDTPVERSLDQPLIYFGRDIGCHIKLANEDLEQIHFILRFENGSFFLIDEGSKKGTWLDKAEVQREKPYPLGSHHLIEVPGFTIEFFWDKNEPNKERFQADAKELLQQLLSPEIAFHKVKCLRSRDQKHRFVFFEKKSIFKLGSHSRADFFIDDDSIKDKQVTFARDISGIRLIPMPRSNVYINNKQALEPHLLMAGDVIKVGNLELLFEDGESQDVNQKDPWHLDFLEAKCESSIPRAAEILEKQDWLSIFTARQKNHKSLFWLVFDRVFLCFLLVSLFFALVGVFQLV